MLHCTVTDVCKEMNGNGMMKRATELALIVEIIVVVVVYFLTLDFTYLYK